MRKNVTNVTGRLAGVADLVRQHQASLSPAERKLARVFLASYPIAGLESVARFAERAGVSAPTVTRSLLVAAHNLQATLELLSHHDVDEVAELLADIKRRILVLGGRVSGPLARYLAAQLHLLRPGIGLVDAERTAAAQQLLDMRKGDVLVVFDYRRYQADTIDSARLVSSQGGNVVLFTDPWLSPASAFAKQVVVTSVETVGPFDSLVGAMAVLEAVVAAVLTRLGPRAQARMQSLERLSGKEVIGSPEP